jgi:lysozyme family protein
MAAATYDEALRRVLAHEGGYSNHPADPGGPTNYGITLKTYSEFKGRRMTAADVRAMPLIDAKAIYRAKYWDRACCDLLPAGLDYALFDFCVNSGTARAAKVLHHILGLASGADVTEATISAVNKREAAELIRRLCQERSAFLRSLKTWAVFAAGWSRRVAEVEAAALRIARDQARHSERLTAGPGKGVVPQGKATERAAAGTVVAVGAAVAQRAHLAGAEPAAVLAVVILFVIVAAGAWLAVRRWRDRRQEKPAKLEKKDA